MSSAKDRALNKARKFIDLLNANGIEIFAAYMFGSAMRGQTDENSDIDIAIVSKDFTGEPFYDVQKVSKYRRAVDLRLEAHPFSLNDALKNPSLFFTEIKNKGIQII
ncbi:conserved hypothetical protein [Candidatus Desulfarcum epimagneticum]|uniref:Polymerase beta nucleotidyltransferase domain-containing protein n=1 Tax=uncultured Desulfobacteraceae bacterium TaxID=218296 RepID=A0A484HLB7_9BACT|nr:conserved hypothetical protein [uncultured Desulfobacteraceae bacterium]